MLPFWTTLKWEYAYVRHDLITEKQGIYVKKWEQKKVNWNITDLPFGNSASKGIFITY